MDHKNTQFNSKEEAAAAERRKVPNLKSLRDMIRRNATGQHQQSSGEGGQVRSERVLKNESECSFTLTDEEDNDGKKGKKSAKG